MKKRGARRISGEGYGGRVTPCVRRATAYHHGHALLASPCPPCAFAARWNSGGGIAKKAWCGRSRMVFGWFGMGVPLSSGNIAGGAGAAPDQHLPPSKFATQPYMDGWWTGARISLSYVSRNGLRALILLPAWRRRTDEQDQRREHLGWARGVHRRGVCRRGQLAFSAGAANVIGIAVTRLSGVGGGAGASPRT